jgi:phosphoglycerate dehydrogenase-like enzyme
VASTATSGHPLVVAIGQTWPDLAIEEQVFAPRGVRIVDGRALAADDPVWAEAAGVLLGTAAKADGAFLRRLRNGQGVVRYGIGYDNVDVAVADELGLVVAIVRDYCIDEVAEHAIASALSLARGLPHWDRSVRAGNWRGKDGPRLRRIANMYIGVIGFGLIGRVVAAKAAGLFGRVGIYDPWAVIGAEDRRLGYEFQTELAPLFERADVLTVHVPLSEATRGLIGADAMARMKRGSIIVNVSRGGIVDEAALIAQVSSGHIGAAALDTFEHEPVGSDNPLARVPNILLSPHVAWLSEESAVTLRQRAAEEIALILDGKPPSAPVSARKTK